MHICHLILRKHSTVYLILYLLPIRLHLHDHWFLTKASYHSNWCTLVKGQHCSLSYTGHVVTRVFACEFEASAAMSKCPFSTLLDCGFQCTSKHSRVISPSAEVNDHPELDLDDDHSQSTVEMSSYPGPAGYACHTAWLATRLSMEH